MPRIDIVRIRRCGDPVRRDARRLWAHEEKGSGVESGSAHSGQLSSRELEILELVAEGWTNREIARHFWVTETTVKFHLTRIYRKLGVTNRTAAAMWLRDTPQAVLRKTRE